MRLLIIPDVHGRHEYLYNAFEQFEKRGCDKVILLGDLADSYDRSNEDILRCFYMARDWKERLGERMVWLIGNHELHYLFENERCSGFRPDLAASLVPWLRLNKELLQVAHQEGKYLFTHAGIQKKWYEKHKAVLESWLTTGQPEGHTPTLAEALNELIWTHWRPIITEVGVKRGGFRGDYGGPLWCDKTEMCSYGPLKGYHQYVGHTPQKYVERVDRFEGDKHYKDTSVTFCDIIQSKGEDFFQILEINDKHRAAP